VRVEGKLAVYALWISANSYFNYSKIDATKGLRPATAPAGLHNAGCTADCFAVIASLISSPRLFLAVCTGLLASALAVAVSNAGGLGSLPCAMLTLDSLRAELLAITAQTTRPYNINFFCLRHYGYSNC